MRWTVETLDATVDDEVAALSSDLRARLSRIGFLIENVGLERLREPYVRHLEGPLWEMRLRARMRSPGLCMSPSKAVVS
jgi:hypothetical protein